MSDSTSKSLTLWSPILIILVAFAIAILAGNVLDVWVWVPIMVVYWFLIALLVWANGGKSLLIRWLAPSKGPWYWNVLALVLVVPLLPSFIGNIHFYSEWWILLLTIVVSLVNPWFEEAYWRGLLLDHTSEWSNWKSLLFSSAFFAINHLPLAVHSIAIRYTIIPVFVMGLVWGIVYKKTKSLRWVILGHILVNLFSLMIPAFMNLLLPPG
jgi:membrane protease YdiL (CAAX protease family)